MKDMPKAAKMKSMNSGWKGTKEMKNKRFIAILLMMVVILSLVPVTRVDAAVKVPVKVTRALKDIVDENGRAIIIDQSAGRMHLYKRNCKSQKWELKKTFRCICGDHLREDWHYFLLRNSDTDKRMWKDGCRTYGYGMYVDCYEEAPVRTVMIHSYVQIGGTTYKTLKKNPTGISLCRENARYIYQYYGDGTAVMGV